MRSAIPERPHLSADVSRRRFLIESVAALSAGYAAISLGAPARTPGTATRSEVDLAYLSIGEASDLIRARRLSPVDLTQACLARIERLNPQLNAFITVTADSALAEARVAESEVQKGRWRGPLHGIPIALKDLIDTAGVRTTAGSAVFKDRIPSEDATVVRKLKEAGAVFLGKLNMHEFAFGATSVTSFYGAVVNPYAADRIAGGSSGGSAAAVAAGLCYAALGSDTGGSIREPAAFCGIVGLKPTYGRVSTRGVVPLAWSLDHIGPMTRSVSDAALVLQAIAGYDLAEPTSPERGVDHYDGPAWRAGSRLRLGVPRTHYFSNLDPEVAAALDEALNVFKKMGAQVQDVPLEVSKDRMVIRAEAYAYHSPRIVATPMLYKPETLAKLRSGETITAETYIAARRDLERLRRDSPRIFSTVDVLVTPTTPVPAPKAADLPSTIEAIVAGEGLLLQNTRSFDINGLPSISVPCGTTRAGLPLGLQLSGAPWAEAHLLSVARAFERATQSRVRRVA